MPTILLFKQEVYSKFTASANIDLNCCDNDIAHPECIFNLIFTIIRCNNNLTDCIILIFSSLFSLRCCRSVGQQRDKDEAILEGKDLLVSSPSFQVEIQISS